jgi:hypothetical protein
MALFYLVISIAYKAKTTHPSLRRRTPRVCGDPQCTFAPRDAPPLCLISDFWPIFFPFGHYDEPEILPYANPPICPKSADVKQSSTRYLKATLPVPSRSLIFMLRPSADSTGLVGAFLTPRTGSANLNQCPRCHYRCGANTPFQMPQYL